MRVVIDGVEYAPVEEKQETVIVGNLEWSHTLLYGKAVTYEEAVAAVAELGEGWRLPIVQGLSTLVDHSRHDPAIDTEKFPDTKSDWYWTSTPAVWREDAVWCVGFGGGNVGSLHRDGLCCVRAVREVAA